VLLWNVNCLTRAKMECSVFIIIIAENDIIFYMSHGRVLIVNLSWLVIHVTILTENFNIDRQREVVVV
jgi:hypothetical protein